MKAANFPQKRKCIQATALLMTSLVNGVLLESPSDEQLTRACFKVDSIYMELWSDVCANHDYDIGALTVTYSGAGGSMSWASPRGFFKQSYINSSLGTTTLVLAQTYSPCGPQGEGYGDLWLTDSDGGLHTLGYATTIASTLSGSDSLDGPIVDIYTWPCASGGKAYCVSFYTVSDTPSITRSGNPFATSFSYAVGAPKQTFAFSSVYSAGVSTVPCTNIMFQLIGADGVANIAADGASIEFETSDATEAGTHSYTLRAYLDGNTSIFNDFAFTVTVVDCAATTITNANSNAPFSSSILYPFDQLSIHGLINVQRDVAITTSNYADTRSGLCPISFYLTPSNTFLTLIGTTSLRLWTGSASDLGSHSVQFGAYYTYQQSRTESHHLTSFTVTIYECTDFQIYNGGTPLSPLSFSTPLNTYITNPVDLTVNTQSDPGGWYWAQEPHDVYLASGDCPSINFALENNGITPFVTLDTALSLIDIRTTNELEEGTHIGVLLVAHFEGYQSDSSRHTTLFDVTIEPSCEIVNYQLNSAHTVPTPPEAIDYQFASTQQVGPFQFDFIVSPCNLIKTYKIFQDNVEVDQASSWLSIDDSVDPVQVQIYTTDASIPGPTYNVKVVAELNTIPTTLSSQYLSSLDFVVNTSAEPCSLIQFDSQVISPMHFEIDYNQAATTQTFPGFTFTQPAGTPCSKQIQYQIYNPHVSLTLDTSRTLSLQTTDPAQMTNNYDVSMLVNFQSFDDYNYLVNHIEHFQITITGKCTSTDFTCQLDGGKYLLGSPTATYTVPVTDSVSQGHLTNSGVSQYCGDFVYSNNLNGIFAQGSDGNVFDLMTNDPLTYGHNQAQFDVGLLDYPDASNALTCELTVEVIPDCNSAIIQQAQAPLFFESAIDTSLSVDLTPIFSYDLVDDYSNYCGPLLISLNPASSSAYSLDPVTNILTLLPTQTDADLGFATLVLSFNLFDAAKSIDVSFVDVTENTIVQEFILERFCAGDSSASCTDGEPDLVTTVAYNMFADATLSYSFEFDSFLFTPTDADWKENYVQVITVSEPADLSIWPWLSVDLATKTVAVSSTDESVLSATPYLLKINSYLQNQASQLPAENLVVYEIILRHKCDSMDLVDFTIPDFHWLITKSHLMSPETISLNFVTSMASDADCEIDSYTVESRVVGDTVDYQSLVSVTAAASASDFPTLVVTTIEAQFVTCTWDEATASCTHSTPNQMRLVPHFKAELSWLDSTLEVADFDIYVESDCMWMSFETTYGRKDLMIFQIGDTRGSNLKYRLQEFRIIDPLGNDNVCGPITTDLTITLDHWLPDTLSTSDFFTMTVDDHTITMELSVTEEIYYSMMAKQDDQWKKDAEECDFHFDCLSRIYGYFATDRAVDVWDSGPGALLRDQEATLTVNIVNYDRQVQFDMRFLLLEACTGKYISIYGFAIDRRIQTSVNFPGGLTYGFNELKASANRLQKKNIEYTFDPPICGEIELDLEYSRMSDRGTYTTNLPQFIQFTKGTASSFGKLHIESTSESDVGKHVLNPIYRMVDQSPPREDLFLYMDTEIPQIERMGRIKSAMTPDQLRPWALEPYWEVERYGIKRVPWIVGVMIVDITTRDDEGALLNVLPVVETVITVDGIDMSSPSQYTPYLQLLEKSEVNILVSFSDPDSNQLTSAFIMDKIFLDCISCQPYLGTPSFTKYGEGMSKTYSAAWTATGELPKDQMIYLIGEAADQYGKASITIPFMLVDEIKDLNATDTIENEIEEISEHEATNWEELETKYNFLFSLGRVYDVEDPEFKVLLQEINKLVPFPFPFITGQSHNGTVDITLSKANFIGEDIDLPFRMQEMILEEHMQIFLAETDENPRIKGTGIFDKKDFVRSNWFDDEERQEFLLNKLDGLEDQSIRRLQDEQKRELFDKKSFKWTMLEFKEKSFKIQLYFEQKESISQNVVDKLELVFKNPEKILMYPLTGAAPEKEFQVAVKLGQMMSEQKALLIAAVAEDATASGLAALSVFVASVFLNYSLQTLLSSVHSLILVVHIPINDIVLAPITSVVYQELIDIVTFDFLGIMDYLQESGTITISIDAEPSIPYNDKFEGLGYESNKSTGNLGSLNIVLGFMYLGGLLYLFTRLFAVCLDKTRVGRRLLAYQTGKGILNKFFQFMTVLYLELLICSLVTVIPGDYQNISQQDFDSLSLYDQFVLIYTWAIVAFCIVYPLVTIIVAIYWIRLINKNILRKYSDKLIQNLEKLYKKALRRKMSSRKRKQDKEQVTFGGEQFDREIFQSRRDAATRLNATAKQGKAFKFEESALSYFKVLTEGLKLTSIGAPLWQLMFFSRRIGIVMTAFSLQGYGSLQVQLLILLSITQFIFLYAFQPQETRELFRTEVQNEAMVYIILMLALVSVYAIQIEPDSVTALTRDIVGWAMVIVIGVFILIATLGQLKQVILQSRRKWVAFKQKADEWDNKRATKKNGIFCLTHSMRLDQPTPFRITVCECERPYEGSSDIFEDFLISSNKVVPAEQDESTVSEITTNNKLARRPIVDSLLIPIPEEEEIEFDEESKSNVGAHAEWQAKGSLHPIEVPDKGHLENLNSNQAEMQPADSERLFASESEATMGGSSKVLRYLEWISYEQEYQSLYQARYGTTPLYEVDFLAAGERTINTKQLKYMTMQEGDSDQDEDLYVEVPDQNQENDIGRIRQIFDQGYDGADEDKTLGSAFKLK